MANGALETGINGTITFASGGTGTLQITPTADATLSSALTLPAGFGQFTFAPASGATLTLADGFSVPGIINFTGPGTLAVATNLSGSGEIIGQTSYQGGTLNISGTVNSSNAGGPAAILDTAAYGTLTNSGAITASGDAINFFGIGINNSGTITAGGTAISAFINDYNVGFSNTGTITSTGGTAVNLSQSCTCETSTNAGTINGAQVGLNLQDGILINTGTITSAGIGVATQYYGTIENEAGGVITGGTTAIGGLNGSPAAGYVSNAGTINGNVYMPNTYAALAGGVLNGNLTLGVGETLITDFANTGSGAFSGINGTVSANQSNLVYTVETSATASGLAPTGFSSLAFALSNNPTLTIAGNAALSAPLGFAGTGSVILNGDLSATNNVAVQTQAYVGGALSNLGQTTPVIRLTNNGNISVSAVTPYSNAQAAVQLGSADILVNNGTISLTNTSGTGNDYYAAVDYGQSITNAGTISGAGAAAVSLQGTLTNTGMITSDQTAVATVGTATIDNSGSIISTGGPAIGAPSSTYYYYGAAPQINNMAGGVITGNGDAIDVTGGSINNAGTINGNVNFATVGYYTAGATYISDGGTLNGNLTFGSGNDTLIVIGNTTGITGAINGGGGYDTYAQGFTASTSVDLTTLAAPAGFSAVGIGALGAGTTVTVTGPAGGVAQAPAYFGDGTIINAVDIHGAGSSLAVSLGQANAALGVGGLNFVNSAAIDPGVSGSVASFSNSGTVGTTTLGYGAVQLTATGPDFTFANSGTIVSADGVYFATPTVSIGAVTNLNSATIDNAGSISDRLYANLASATLSVTNSGTIGSPSGSIAGLYVVAAPLAVAAGTNPSTTSLTVTNTAAGTVQGGISAGGTTQNLTVSNAGLVNGTLYGFQNRGIIVDPTTQAETASDQVSASLVNSGTVAGNLVLSAVAGAVSLTNSGSTAQAGSPYGGVPAASVYNATTGNNTVTATNRGSLTNTDIGGGGLVVATFAGDGTDPASSSTAAAIVTNSGVIAVSGGSQYQGPFNYYYFKYPAYDAISAGVAVTASGTGGSSATVTNAAGGLISASGGTTASAYSPSPVPAGLVNAGAVGLIVRADAITITNAGTISGGPDIVLPAGTNVYLGDGEGSLPNLTIIAGGIEAYGKTVAFTNAAGGVVNGDIDLSASTSASVANQGTINGNVTFGAGNVSFTENLGGTLGGTVTGGSGSNTLLLDATGGGTLSQALLDSFVNFSAPQIIGSGTVTTTGAITTPTLTDSGALTLGNAFTLNGALAVTSGALLDLGGNVATIDSVTLTGATLRNGTLNSTGGITSSDSTISGLAGTTSVTATAGTTALSGVNSYSGGTVVTGGVLSVQGAQALGTGGVVLNPATQLILAGNGFNIANPITLAAPADPTITVASGNTDTLSGVISGPGALTVNGGGTLVLDGINTYTGATTVAASHLVVNGSIASSASLTLTAGSMISGSGAIGALKVSSGATLTAGTGGTSGQLTINGNLTFANGSYYAVSASPMTSTSVAVNGTATLTGATVLTNVTTGRYLVNRYTILSASGGLGGTTFAGLQALSLPAGIQQTLSYDANDVYLTLTGLIDGGATSGLPRNQQAVTNAINGYFNGGGAVPMSFLGFSALSGAPLVQAMASLSGELPTATPTVAEQIANTFLGDMLDPFAQGRRAAACANTAGAPIGAVRSAQPSCASLPKYTVWASAMGGHSRVDGNAAAAGTHDLRNDTFGFASGVDVRVAPGATLGLAVADGRAQWSLAQGLGNAHTDYFEIGANAALQRGRGYLSAALAYGWHRVSEKRYVFGGDTLGAGFHAHDVGGRIEAGVHLGALSPYGAFQAQRVTMPGFTEGDAGMGDYALSFAGRSFSDTSGEAGVRLDASRPAGDGNSLGLRLRAAYVHDWVDNPVLAADFVSLPGAGFRVAGATPARNSAVVSSALEYHVGQFGTFFAKFDGQLANKSQTYQGSFGLRFDW